MKRKPIVIAFVSANLLIGTAILVFAVLNGKWWLTAATAMLYGYTYLLTRWLGKIGEAADEDAQQMRQIALSINFVIMLFAMILFFIGLRFAVEEQMQQKGTVGTCIVQEGCTEEKIRENTEK